MASFPSYDDRFRKAESGPTLSAAPTDSEKGLFIVTQLELPRGPVIYNQLKWLAAASTATSKPARRTD